MGNSFSGTQHCMPSGKVKTGGEKVKKTVTKVCKDYNLLRERNLPRWGASWKKDQCRVENEGAGKGEGWSRGMAKVVAPHRGEKKRKWVASREESKEQPNPKACWKATYNAKSGLEGKKGQRQNSRGDRFESGEAQCCERCVKGNGQE